MSIVLGPDILHHKNGLKKTYKPMIFTTEEIEVIKDSLTIALHHSQDLLDDEYQT